MHEFRKLYRKVIGIELAKLCRYAIWDEQNQRGR